MPGRPSTTRIRGSVWPSAALKTGMEGTVGAVPTRPVDQDRGPRGGPCLQVRASQTLAASGHFVAVLRYPATFPPVRARNRPQPSIARLCNENGCHGAPARHLPVGVWKDPSQLPARFSPGLWIGIATVRQPVSGLI
jgi:hypothetical protein